MFVALPGVIVTLPAMSSFSPTFSVTPSVSSSGSVIVSTGIFFASTFTSKCECLPPTLMVIIARPGSTAFTTPDSSTVTIFVSDDS